MKIMVTGGAGFIGSNFVKYMLGRYDYKLLNVDLLTYAGNLESLCDVDTHSNYTFAKADIASKSDMEPYFDEGIDAVINFAAEAHVDRSIKQPDIFVRTNILGTQNLLDLAKKYKTQRFVQVSTDEVYGTLGATGYFTEETPLSPNSPYSASKAGADLLARAYYETFGMNISITRCSNNYGPYQFPEKLIPLMTINALNGKALPVYGDGLNVRDWLYVEDHCSAIDTVFHKGRAGEVYNIGGNSEKTNIEIVKLILNALGKDASLIKYVTDRPGHDRRYAIDASKIKNDLGWEPGHVFAAAMKLTIDWYVENKPWWEKIISGEYKDYYKHTYGIV